MTLLGGLSGTSNSVAPSRDLSRRSEQRRAFNDDPTNNIIYTSWPLLFEASPEEHGLPSAGPGVLPSARALRLAALVLFFASKTPTFWILRLTRFLAGQGASGFTIAAIKF